MNKVWTWLERDLLPEGGYLNLLLFVSIDFNKDKTSSTADQMKVCVCVCEFILSIFKIAMQF